MKSKLNCKIVYFDIDNFKAYNDVYGFENGDRFLKHFTQILKTHIPDEDFIGHIGGDDFISILYRTTPRQSAIKSSRFSISPCCSIINRTTWTRALSSRKTRYGNEEALSLLSLTIVGTTATQYNNIYDLSENIARMKRFCKLKEGSNCMIT